MAHEPPRFLDLPGDIIHPTEAAALDDAELLRRYRVSETDAGDVEQELLAAEISRRGLDV